MGESFSILTDFSSWDSCKFDDFFLEGWGMHFWQRNKKNWEDTDCVNSRKFSVFVKKNHFHPCICGQVALSASLCYW
jgi:hypothetical protein